MQRHYGRFQDNEGRAYPGASVTVYLAGTSTLATLYAASGSISAPSGLANPFTTDSLGNYGFAVGNGTYDIQISGGGMPTEYITNLTIGTTDITSIEASSVTFVPALTIASTEVQAAITEVVSDLADPTAIGNGDALVAVKAPYTGSTARTQHGKNAERITVTDFAGVDPTGATDSTAGIVAAYTALAADGELIIPVGTYKIGATNFSGKNCNIRAYGAKFVLDGNGAGIFFKGHIDRLVWMGGRITGDGVNRDSVPGQFGISVANYAGDAIENVTIRDAYIKDCNVGILISYGITPTTVSERAFIVDCHISGSKGKTGGRGYGIQVTQAPGTCIIGGSVRDCERHGLYFSEGQRYRAIGLEVSGCGLGTGTLRGAVALSRSSDVQFIGGSVHDNLDVGMHIDTDALGITPKDEDGVLVQGGIFKDNAYGDIRIGATDDPATDGVSTRVMIHDVIFVQPVTCGASAISLRSTIGCSITGCMFDMTKTVSAVTRRWVALEGIGAGTYNDQIFIKNNTFHQGAGLGSICYAFQVVAALTTTCTSYITIVDNPIYAIGSTIQDFEFIGTEAAINNNNFIYNRFASGKCVRTLTATGSDLVVAVGGVDRLTLSPGSATTYHDFTGGEEGQELNFFFTNSNATLKNSHIWFVGAGGDFTGSANDTITLVYAGGGWREKCRSVNV